jgi:hypothetical protein
MVLLMTYIGGPRVFFGPVLGAVVIGLRKIWLSDITPVWLAAANSTLEAGAMVAPPMAPRGRGHELDVLAFATGFEVVRPPFAAHLRARGDQPGRPLPPRHAGL